MSARKKGKTVNEKNGMFGKKHTNQWCENHSAALSGEKHFNYGKEAFTKGRIWMNNSSQSKMVKPENVQCQIDQGWIRGRL